MNKPVNFEIAKMLKEKGWNKPTLHFFFEDGVQIENSYEDTVGMDYGSPFEVEFYELTSNWNSGWVKKKDGSMCFGCDKSKGYLDIYSAPTIADVVMWLYEKHGIWIECLHRGDMGDFTFKVSKLKKRWRTEPHYLHDKGFSSPTEAYEAAIDYTLKNLIP